MEVYYNTTNLTGPDLADSRQRANSQDDRILSFFHKNPNHEYTPCEVHRILGIGVLTSVRRSMTNLTDRGLLEKTSNKRIGIHGKPAYTWRLAVQRGQMRLF